MVKKWLSQQHAAIIEGEQIHPRLAEQLSVSDDIRSVFLIESDPKRLYLTLKQRSQRFRALSKSQQHRVVEMNRLYGEWLRSQAEQRQLTWINAQPWSALKERVFTHLSNLRNEF